MGFVVSWTAVRSITFQLTTNRGQHVIPYLTLETFVGLLNAVIAYLDGFRDGRKGIFFPTTRHEKELRKQTNWLRVSR